MKALCIGEGTPKPLYAKVRGEAVCRECVVGNFSGRQDPLEMALKSRSDIVMPLMKTKGENVLYGLGDSRATGNLDLVVPMRCEENDYYWAQTLG